MRGKLKGLILSNFLYLIMFYLVYYIAVLAALYGKQLVCSLDIFTVVGGCSAIPNSTNNALLFLLFVVIPIAAFIFTLKASTEPQYVYTG